jgi:hypothetical protein
MLSCNHDASAVQLDRKPRVRDSHFGIGALTGDFAQLFEGGFEVFDDFLGENVGLGKVIGLFEALSRSHKTSTVRKKLLNPLLDVVLD